ncbi:MULTISPECIES: hypothetical protein [Halobacterium]|uniref:hypothetical protein n=1 Tax=Halobacterium TaxID=2239 RepID=UPI00073F53C9|nr:MULTISPECIES: hypothetical protein [Halobacterium]MCG1002990.1 hypothetical protein [Halobacterium noricense]
MPVSTDSAAWQEGDEHVTKDHLLLDFLKNSPQEAFHIREIVDEIAGLDWAEIENQLRREDELPEDEGFAEDEREDYAITYHYRETAFYEERLNSLVEKGLVDVKVVDASGFGDEVPDNWDTVAAYSYHTE